MIPADLQAGADARRNWPTINSSLAELRRLSAESGQSRDSVENLRRISSRLIADSYPFRVYRKPNSLRLTKDPDWWRKFTVQHGYVNNVKTATTDDTDGEWGEATGTPTQTIEIPVPPGLAKYYIWVTTTAGPPPHNTIDSGPTPWPAFPNATSGSTNYTLLARIDTLTQLTAKQAIIRQFVFSDIITSTGGSGDAIWLP